MQNLRFDFRRVDDPLDVAVDVVILPVTEELVKSRDMARLDQASGGTLRDQAKDAGFRGQKDRGLLHRLPREAKARALYLVGLGPKDQANGETWRRAGGRSLRAARGTGATTAAVGVGDAEPVDVTALVEGFVLAGYDFLAYRKPKEERKEVTKLVLAGPRLDRRALAPAFEQLRTIAGAVFAARDLVNEPPSIKTPAVIARRAVAMCRRSGVRVEVFGPAKIRSMRLNGLLAVNRGSAEEPRFLRIRYRPKGRPRKKIAIVGKGITFDSGGLSLKPAKSMETMKCDMAGAAAVLGVMSVLGKLRPRAAVTGYVALTENLPGAKAQKPGDVIRYRNGKTVEVLNTDAEGRLVLADALALASEEKHDVIIDLATLTGACMVALGSSVAGIMGNRKDLVDELVRHGEETGEALWPLPLVADYRRGLDSKIADLKNIAGPYGGTITAGLFLQEFVDGAGWAHLDIAGPAFSENDLPYCRSGGTGFGVRALLRYLASV